MTMPFKILAVGALLLAAAPIAQAKTAKPVMAYFESGSGPDLQASYRFIDQLSTDAFSVTADGAIHGAAPALAMRLARQHGMQTFATVSNFGDSGFSAAVADDVLNSPTAIGVFTADASKILAELRYTGIDIDFESVPAKDRGVFSSFVQTLAQALRKDGYRTMISVPAMSSGDPRNSWTDAFDLAALAKSADILQYMTYDQHGPWSDPGPVAGLDWDEACVRYAVGVAPPGKLSLGLPAYGYDWNLTKKTGVQIPWKDIPALMAKIPPSWDTASASPYFHYTSPSGDRHIVWYEDTKSIQAKTNLAMRYDLASVSIYALGMEDAAFWKAVDDALKP